MGPASIRTVDAAIFASTERFRREIVEPCEPVVVRQLVRHWPLVEAAADSPASLRAYLARFATPARAEAFVGRAEIAGRYAYGPDLETFNFTRVESDLIGAVDRILANAADPGAPTLYLGSLEASVFLPGFAAENALGALPPSIGPRIWIGNASNISCHNDTYDNVACVAAGHRRFTLYPPDALPDLYVGPLEFTMAGRPISLAASSAAGDSRYPRFVLAQERALVAELGPGDAIYLPKLWWHQVEAMDRVNVLVNYWWDAFMSGPDAPETAMMLALIAIAERPAREREAWRAFFDHYVFRGDGHPLAHLSPEKHGILGPLSSGNYGRIRAMIMKLLRGG
jgi:hypothetical protein